MGTFPFLGRDYSPLDQGQRLPASRLFVFFSLFQLNIKNPPLASSSSSSFLLTFLTSARLRFPAGAQEPV